MNVDVYVKANDSYKLTVLLLENGIVGDQKDGSATVHDFVHNKVARIALTPVTGESFQGREGEVNSFQYSCSVPDGYVKDNLEIVAYVQRPFGTLPVIASDNYGGWFIDNSRAVSVGGSAELELD